ncbi:hypothetical protein Hanom_Chr10g00873631 [Helianthus anomalus]
MVLLLRIRSVRLLLQVVQNHDRDGLDPFVSWLGLDFRSVRWMLQVVQNHDCDGGGRDGVGLIRGGW